MKVVQITQVDRHPKISSLKVCRVSDGGGEFTVVCGAGNVRAGMKTILAVVGDTLPGGRAIGAIELGGVYSEGMLCSARNLGVSQEAGIVDLPQELALGMEAQAVDRKWLSSVPWHSYQRVDALYWNPKARRIAVARKDNRPPRGGQLISETYYHQGNYRYRDFLWDGP